MLDMSTSTLPRSASVVTSPDAGGVSCPCSSAVSPSSCVAVPGPLAIAADRRQFGTSGRSPQRSKNASRPS